MPAEAATELGSDTSAPRLSLWRQLRIAMVEWRLDVVIDERNRYEEAGAIGPIYHRNSLVLQRQLITRIRVLREQWA